MYETANTNRPGVQLGSQIEESRPVTSTMTEIASAVGDLETAIRALAGRISPLLPAGNPYNRVDGSKGEAGTSVPRPVRSHFNDQLQTRLYELRGITASVNEMVKGIEL